MQYTDLHCDTLYKAVTDNKSFDEGAFEVNVQKGREFSDWTQCMAIWIPDDFTPETQMQLFTKSCEKLRSESEKFSIPVGFAENKSNCNFLFTVENGAFLNSDIRNIELLTKNAVKMLTLTWNGENCIGGGAECPEIGLKPFGLECVRALEKASVIIDVSHASDRLLFNVAEIATKPFVASHSNSRTVCPHRRNLNDEQFEIIRKNGGLVGLNFHRDFLSENPAQASIKSVLLHAEHFLSMGGEDVLCIGSDFDGANPIDELNSLDKISILYEEFLKIGYTEQLVQKIMYYNAHNFLSRF